MRDEKKNDKVTAIYKAIRNGKVGAVLLAGGQGSRLNLKSFRCLSKSRNR